MGVVFDRNPLQKKKIGRALGRTKYKESKILQQSSQTDLWFR